jgi:hypothetical protein
VAAFALRFAAALSAAASWSDFRRRAGASADAGTSP